MIKDMVWAEKYRPKVAEDYIFPSKEMESSFESWKRRGVIPNLILHGIQGTGKSTLAEVIKNEFNLQSIDVLTLNGSTQNKIEHIRELESSFLKIRPMGEFKLVVIEEAHRLTDDAQSALLIPMERVSHTRFILTTNHVSKLKPELQSRFTSFNFEENDELRDRIASRLYTILQSEGVNVGNDETVEKLIEHVDFGFPDIRKSINSIQESIKDNQLTLPISNSNSGVALDEWEKLWADDSGKEFDVSYALELCSLIDSGNYDSFFEIIYMKGLHQFDDEAKAVILLSDYLTRCKDVAFQSLHMQAFIYRAFGDYDG